MAAGHGERDPFHVIGKIPKGRAYQWVAESVDGNKDIVRESLDWMRAAGWKPVPASRHPKMKSRGKRIAFGGQILMENSAVDAAAARSKQVASAKAMHDDNPASMSTRPYPHSGKFNCTFATVYGPFPASFEFPETVEITLPLKLSPNLINAAAICALPVVEYARRMIALILRGDLTGVLVPTLERDAFEVRDIVTTEK